MFLTIHPWQSIIQFPSLDLISCNVKLEFQIHFLDRFFLTPSCNLLTATIHSNGVHCTVLMLLLKQRSPLSSSAYFFELQQNQSIIVVKNFKTFPPKISAIQIRFLHFFHVNADLSNIIVFLIKQPLMRLCPHDAVHERFARVQFFLTSFFLQQKPSF